MDKPENASSKGVHQYRRKSRGDSFVRRNLEPRYRTGVNWWTDGWMDGWMDGRTSFECCHCLEHEDSKSV